jgi:glycosyltransferase involved in cell wall biosynthesis
VDADRITLLPNGVDTTRFTPRVRDDALAAQLGLTGRTVIGYLGSVVSYEGLELLVEAAAILRTRQQDFRVLIVGDGAALDELRASVTDAGLEGHVVFTGRVPHGDIERYHSLVDIAPLPRLPLPVCEMVSPLKPFESMAMGQVVVASDVAALAEIVEPGVNGLLHTKGDAGDLAHQLGVLLEDPALVQRLAGQAREWVVRERDWSRIVRTVEDTYARLATVPAAVPAAVPVGSEGPR